ncbi:SPOR domain-containing protein [Dysgonomonas sp. BGC7]|uniref:SPOR domain-containing protein n=1 Tax=Dysgonomonas sp. BGC7 TaxID=1658008 RepID=UPI0006821DD1|nr:SPOR domain-containing protein [Dysgonomonas sp. BGC7]MBD8389391.1 SPOR domain-containing protein [Dysgonomonas sp. BGC7]
MNKKLIGIGLAVVLLVGFGSCKPKQSAYKQVYESAKEREMDENTTAPNNTTVTRPSTTPTYSSTTESVRKEKVTPVYESDASGLKAYSVVIAAMAMKPGAESLKERFGKEGYNVILARNEQGMYRVIIASYESKEQAVAKKNEILEKYLSTSDQASLRSKYGIPFNDWWILQREY